MAQANGSQCIRWPLILKTSATGLAQQLLLTAQSDNNGRLKLRSHFNKSRSLVAVEWIFLGKF